MDEVLDELKTVIGMLAPDTVCLSEVMDETPISIPYRHKLCLAEISVDEDKDIDDLDLESSDAEITEGIEIHHGIAITEDGEIRFVGFYYSQCDDSEAIFRYSEKHRSWILRDPSWQTLSGRDYNGTVYILYKKSQDSSRWLGNVTA